MEDRSNNASDADEIGAAFLATDLETAMTFLDVAETSRNEVTVRRNVANARRAYDTVLRLLPKTRLGVAERKAIEVKLAALKQRLTSSGQRL
jgi:hypothetical protein